MTKQLTFSKAGLLLLAVVSLSQATLTTISSGGCSSGGHKDAAEQRRREAPRAHAPAAPGVDSAYFRVQQPEFQSPSEAAMDPQGGDDVREGGVVPVDYVCGQCHAQGQHFSRNCPAVEALMAPGAQAGPADRGFVRGDGADTVALRQLIDRGVFDAGAVPASAADEGACQHCDDLNHLTGECPVLAMVMRGGNGQAFAAQQGTVMAGFDGVSDEDVARMFSGLGPDEVPVGFSDFDQVPQAAGSAATMVGVPAPVASSSATIAGSAFAACSCGNLVEYGRLCSNCGISH